MTISTIITDPTWVQTFGADYTPKLGSDGLIVASNLKRFSGGSGITGVRINGYDLEQAMGNLRDSITAISVTLGYDKETEVSLTFADPGLRMFHDVQFNSDTTLDWWELELEVTNTDIAGGTGGIGEVTIKARSRLVGALKRRVGELIMHDAAPVDFVIAECEAVGLRYLAQPGVSTGGDIARLLPTDTTETPIPSSWTTFLDLASKEAVWCFEALGTLYWGQPTWLMEQTQLPMVFMGWPGNPMKFTPDTWPTEIPTLKWERYATDFPWSINATFPIERAVDFVPGRVLFLSGFEYFDGQYICNELTFDLTGTTCSISASNVHNPQPGIYHRKQTGQGGTSGTTTTEGAEAVVTYMYAIRVHESGAPDGDYTVQSTASSASGAYQYLSSTWNNYQGYSAAWQAPRDVQDQRMQADSLRNYNGEGSGSWPMCAVIHFIGHAVPESEWKTYNVPGSSNPTIAQYVQDIKNLMSNAPPKYTVTSQGGTGGGYGRGQGSALVNEMIRIGKGRSYSQVNRLGPDSFDCSGLIYVAAKNLGYYNGPAWWTGGFPENWVTQFNWGQQQEGDILLWRNFHVGVCMAGNDQMYSARNATAQPNIGISTISGDISMSGSRPEVWRPKKA